MAQAFAKVKCLHMIHAVLIGMVPANRISKYPASL
ncbi:hypothetical protein X727_05480 [Mesorhizobium sp. L103C119B0]|nr:hypothetical protein X727_05480 [Mesorhizobium sp. L103C119B0]